MKTVAIVQSSYIPWKGYFDLIRSCDEFIIYDDVQFTRRDWRSRNCIKTRDGLQWLSIPLKNKGKYLAKINEMAVADLSWREDHWENLRHAYAAAPAFAQVGPEIARWYQTIDSPYLSMINLHFIRSICKVLDIRTALTQAEDYQASGQKSERLLHLCLAAKAGRYISGPSAQAYLDVQLFARHGMEVQWFDYSGYPQYSQLHGVFEHQVSILDALFNVGLDGAGKIFRF